MIFKTMTNTSGKTGIQPNNFFSGLFNGDLFKERTFSLSEVLSTSDVDAIKAYNKQIDNCVTSQTAFNRTMLNTSNEAQNVVAAANGNKVALDGLTKSSKAAELGMKALATAGNMLLIYALTSAIDIIYKCAIASDRLAESAAQMGSEFASTKSDISDYKTKIEELYQTINDDTSSYEDTYNARQELLKIQDEMIDKFGDEADAVKLVTDAINGQTDSLDTLTQDKWQETVNAFNSDRGKGWTEKVADAFANIGHGNNFQRMIDEMEDAKVTFHMIPMYGDDTYEQFSKKLKEDFGADITRSERDDVITLSGDLDTIYKQLLNIQTLAKGMGIDDTFLNDLGKQANEAKSKLDEYQEMYSQHVLYDKIFYSEDYEKSFDEINKAYEKYQDAFTSGDEEAIEKAKQNYAEIVQGAIEGLDDQSVIDYFNNMYPDLQEVVGGWEFEVKFKAAVDDDGDDFENEVKNAVSQFNTVEELKHVDKNPKNATDEQKDAYLQLKQYADDYGLTLDQLIDKLVQLGLLQSQSKSDLLNKLIPSKSTPTAGVTSALTDAMDSVNAAEATKWVESLTEEEAKLANSKDFENALEEQKKKLNGASLSADDYAAALQAVKDKQNAVPNNTPLSFTDQLTKVQSLKTGFDQLKSIYDDVENAGTFDFSSIIGNTDFQTAFGKYTEEYENFIQTISNSPNDIQKCQDAFNQLATAYIYNSDALKSLDGSAESTSAAINMLSSMGISNAQEIVNHVIAAKNAYRELAVAVGETTYSTENLEEATISDMYALLNEGDMADKTKNQILAYYLQKQSAAGLQFSSEADCEQLKAVVSVLGVASSAWDTYYEHKQNIEKFTKKAENAKSSKAKKSAEKWAYLSALEADKELTQMKADIAKITSNVSYAPSVKYTSPTKINNTAKDSAKDAEKTAKDTEKEIEDLVDKFMAYMEKSLDAGKINYQTYCNSVKGYLDDLYNKGQISAAKYFSSVEKMLQKQKDIYDRVLSAIAKRYDDEIKKIEESIDALNKKNDSLNKEKDKYDSILSAINDVYDTEIKRLQDKQDAIQDSVDKLNDENDALDLQKRKEQALDNLRKAQNQNTKRLYVEGRGWIYDTDRQAIADANKEYQDIKTEELIDKLQKEKDAIDSSIDKLNEMKEKWNEVANAYEKSVNRQNAALYFGSEYEKRILSSNITDVSTFRDQYISIQSQINSNEELINSYEEKKEYYSKLKEEWSNISTTLEEQRDRQYAAQLLGANWEKNILDGRLDVLNNFKKQYVQIQNDMAEAARQAAAAELNSPSGSTSGRSGSGGYSGGSSGGYTGGGSIGGGNSGGTKSNPAIVRFQRMCKETLGGNVDITGVKDTKTTNAIKYLQAMLSNDRRIGLRGYSSGMWDRKTFDAMWKWLNRPANKKHKDWITNNIGGLPAPTFEHGGLIKRNISDSSTINQLGGENALIYAREGERVLTQNQNRQWEKWTDAMPQLMETLTNLQTDYSIPKPNYSMQLGNSIKTMKQDVNITQHITVTLPNVTNEGGYENLTKFLDGLYADSIQYSNRRK